MSFNALGNFVKNVFLFWLKVTFLFFLKLCNFSYTKVNVMPYASSFLLRMIVIYPQLQTGSQPQISKLKPNERNFTFTIRS